MLREFLERKPLGATAAGDLFELLYEHDVQETRDILLSLIVSRHSPTASPLAPTAAAFLMAHAPVEYGKEIIEICIGEPAFGQAVVPRLVRGRHTPGWLAQIAPHDVGRFWDWLEANFPGDPYEKDDDGKLVAKSITVSHDIYHFRRGVLDTLLRNGTRAACAAMAELMRKRPQDFWLGNQLAEMRNAARRATWSPPHPRELMQMFADKERRLIRTAGDLHALVIESIKRFDERLHGNPPSTELWNCPSDGKEKIWDPKDENELSNCLKRHIESDLEKRGIIANREVQITRRFGDQATELVDLLVQATPFEENGTQGPCVSVIVEVKCAWNKDLFEDMKQQLYGRYLQRDFDFGIYLVAQFACSVWNREPDWRKDAAGTRIPIPELQLRLDEQAGQLSTQEKKVSAIVIDAGMN